MLFLFHHCSTPVLAPFFLSKWDYIEQSRTVQTYFTWKPLSIIRITQDAHRNLVFTISGKLCRPSPRPQTPTRREADAPGQGPPATTRTQVQTMEITARAKAAEPRRRCTLESHQPEQIRHLWHQLVASIRTKLPQVLIPIFLLPPEHSSLIYCSVLGSGGGRMPIFSIICEGSWFPVHSTDLMVRSLILSAYIACVAHFMV